MLELSEMVTASGTHRLTVGLCICLDDLIAALGSDDESIRRDARFALARIGRLATPSLVSALVHPSAAMRSEAARTLRCIGDPEGAPALVRTLDDDDSDVRWFATEALIAVGQWAVDPLLQALGELCPSLGLLDGAHRVFHNLDRRESLPAALRPVLRAMEGAEPFVNAPPAAQTAQLTLAREAGHAMPVLPSLD
jgi:hypothetical protein